MTSARPPVAITTAARRPRARRACDAPARRPSRRNRRTAPTASRQPCSADDVAGLRTSTRGRRAARWKSASAEIPMPGQITPPRYSPPREMTSKVVPVPKSTTMTGPSASVCSRAATALTMRSAPTSPAGI